MLSPDVARKIAAGEVIDRPQAIVRELMDNAVDSGASRITVEITGGGIERIRVVDDGCGMSREDLMSCARPHATSKISTEQDLLRLTTLGFRGEALASMAAVSRLQITSGTWRMSASVTEDHLLTPVSPVQGTIVQTEGLFENFPARRQFLKRPYSEGALCRSMFEEKALARPDIAFSLSVDGEERLNLPKDQPLAERFCQTLGLSGRENLFYEITGGAADKSWAFTLVIGEPDVSRPNRKNILIYVNGRRIDDRKSEFSLVQAIEYGCQGYFPNGTHPVAALFVSMDSSLVDFNIHPAKREVRFKDISALHHGVSSGTRDFFRKYTARSLACAQAEPGAAGTHETPATGQGQELTEYYRHLNDCDAYKTTHKSLSRLFLTEKSGAETHRSALQELFASQEEPPRAYGAQESGASPEDGAGIQGRVTQANYIQNQDEMHKGAVHFVGQALGTFLIAERNDVLYIIDQHAAHERYLYNKILEESGQSQSLLVPYRIKTKSTADDNFLSELSGSMRRCGFECESKGNGEWEISAVPARWKGTQEDLEKALLDKRINPGDIINSAAAGTACRSAVMDGDVLDRDTAAWLCREALSLPDPHCPHGRPVYTTITRRQLFALVKRL